MCFWSLLVRVIRLAVRGDSERTFQSDTDIVLQLGSFIASSHTAKWRIRYVECISPQKFRESTDYFRQNLGLKLHIRGR